jgi:hypothetical protein
LADAMAEIGRRSEEEHLREPPHPPAVDR